MKRLTKSDVALLRHLDRVQWTFRLIGARKVVVWHQSPPTSWRFDINVGTRMRRLIAAGLVEHANPGSTGASGPAIPTEAGRKVVATVDEQLAAGQDLAATLRFAYSLHVDPVGWVPPSVRYCPSTNRRDTT